MRRVLRRWWPVLLLLALLAALQARLWYGPGGWREARALQETVDAQRTENARLQQRNDALSAEVEDLKSGETAVEERARSELGMVKPGETFYRVVEPHSPEQAAPPPPRPTGDGEPIEHKDAQHGEAGAPDAEPTE